MATPTQNYGAAAAPNGLKVTPLARRLIAQNGLDLAAVAASVAARGGKRIAEEDVRRAISDGAGPAAAPARHGLATPIVLEGASIPLSAIRQKTADRLAENWRTIPHVFQAIEIDFTAVETVRSQAQGSLPRRHTACR